MLRKDGYEFAQELERTVIELRETDSSKMLNASIAQLNSTLTVLNKAKEVARTEVAAARLHNDRSTFKNFLTNAINCLAKSSGATETRKPITFVLTVKWLADAFFAAPSDVERQIIVAQSKKLTAFQKTSWYM